MAIPRNKTNPILLIKRLHDQKGGRIIYVPNRGNVGDALIASATWQMFEKNELSVDLYDDQIGN